MSLSKVSKTIEDRKHHTDYSDIQACFNNRADRLKAQTDANENR